MMRFPKKIFPLLAVLAALLAAALPARAQGDAMFTQYWAMPSYYNPSMIGQIDFIRIRLAGKLQWIGIENAPQSYVLTADMPIKIGKKKPLAIGVMAESESIGLYRNIVAGAQISYKFNWLKGDWSIGVQPGFYNSTFKGSDIYIPDVDDFHNSSDTYLPTKDVTGYQFDISAGISYTHKYFSVGASVLHITEPTVTMDSSSSSSSSDSETIEFQTVLPRQAYFTAMGNIPLKNSLFSLQPSLLVRTDFSTFTPEVTMRSTYNRIFSFGLGYRYKESISAMIAVEFKNFFVGYAYDYPMSAISKASSGSHELVAGYNVKLNLGDKNKNKQRSIRIM